MCKVMYPRACPKCGKKISNRGNFSRHKKHCGTSEHRVQCPHCPKTYSRKDDLKAQVKKFHSEAAKRKAEENAELLRLELLNSEKIPRLSNDEQIGGAVTGKENLNLVKEEEPKPVKRKLEDKGDVDMSHLMDDGLDDVFVERANRLELSENPLFKANLTFLPYKSQGLKGAVKKEQFPSHLISYEKLKTRNL